MYFPPVIILFFSVIAGQTEAFNYTVTAAQRFQPNSYYKFVVAIYGEGSFDYDLDASIKSKHRTISRRIFQHLRDTHNVLDLKIPRIIDEGNYLFEVIASGDVTFNKSHKVDLEQKTHSIFIQTDKTFYKPGQTVLFRVLAIQADLKPYTNELSTTIYDFAGNKIYELLNQKNQSGVINGRLKLSNITPLGRWKIESISESIKKEVNFEVAEYVLPKFEIKFLSPNFYFANPSSLQPLHITVTATYTFGKPVKGHALVTIQVQGRHGNVFRSMKMQYVQLIDGKADVIVTVEEILHFHESVRSHYSDYRTIFVRTNITEEGTGIMLDKMTAIPIVLRRYKLKFLDVSSNNFKPGFPYRAYMKLSQKHGSKPKLSDIKYNNGEFKSLKVVVKHHFDEVDINDRQIDKEGETSVEYFPRNIRYNRRSTSTSNFSFPLTKSGFIFYEIPTHNSSFISIEAKFYDEVTGHDVMERKDVNMFGTRDKKNIYLSIASDVTTIKPGTTIEFNVNTTEIISSFQVQVLGKGKIIYTDLISFESKLNSTTFSLNFDYDMALNLAPQANIVVYYVTSTGELVADSLSLPVVDYMANKVSLSISPETTAPGEEVVLKINASQDSFVSLSAIDQSVLLLSAGNDITQDLVFKDFSQYSNKKNVEKEATMFWKFHKPCQVGGRNSKNLLKNSGVFILTDFHLDNRWNVEPLYSHRHVPYLRVLAIKPRNRDMLVGVVSSISPSTSTNYIKPQEKIRKYFPETWIWTDEKIGSDGMLQLKYKVPDTITSWVASAFATNSRFGLGITENPAKVTVIKPFFASLNLPYSIIRGEQFALQVSVFNYFGEDLTVTVIMPKSNYYHVKECVQGSERSLQDSDAQNNIFVKNNDMVTLYFWIVPTSLGQIPIEVRAVTAVAADSVIEKLLVKPEGQPQSYSSSSLIRLPSDDLSVINFDVSLPPHDILVPDSVTIEATVIGDVLGTTINNLDNLLQMPTGCGEQNMLNLAPDVYIVKYLNATNQLTDVIKNKAVGFINAGYQTELTYQRNDGSFSAFGNRDTVGSIWLSAFVIKVFRDAKDIIPIQEEKIANTLRWILHHQREDGSFQEVGKVIHTEMQGKASSGLGLTAYVLISLLVNRDIKVEGISEKISLTVSYLEQQYEAHQQDPYILSIIGYAFYLAGSPKLNDVLERLNTLAIQEHGMKYWHKEVVGEETTLTGWRPIYSQPQSNDVEMTSYVLLTYASQLLLTDSIPIAKWLISKRNPEGGFTSTQDTVIGLEALAISGRIFLPPINSGGLNVDVTQNANENVYNFSIVNKNTSLLLQSHQIPSNATTVTFSTSGEGLALIQLNVRYHVKTITENSFFKQYLNTFVLTNSSMTLQINASWDGPEETGMVLIEVYLLTGYTLAGDYADVLKNEIGSILKKEEFSNNRLSIYLDELTEISFTVKMKSIYYVKDVKPALVKSYRYYSPGVSVSGYYSPTSTSATMDVCDPIFNQPDSNVANEI